MARVTEDVPRLGGESAVVARTLSPRTTETLRDDLRQLGVRPGDVLLVHSRLSAVGWICGAEVAAVHALRDVVGREGTLVVPTQTASNSDPAEWSDPPVPKEWWPTIRETTPAYDPAVTASRGMGRLPEALRTWPGAARSAHPQTSFAALGRDAAALMSRHDLDCRFGGRSPLAALEAAGARVLLLGAGYGSCTAFHLAETRIAGAPTEEQSCAVGTPAGREWVTYRDVVADETDFGRIGAAWDATGEVWIGRVGAAESRLFDLADGVAFATGWIRRHRGSDWRG
jgi:aminoglycoside 3-N-acetyltransferase